MFTGIIQHLGTLKKRTKNGAVVHFVFEVKGKLDRPFKLGQSIAVNGVCLTAAKVGKKSFDVDVIAQTLSATSLGELNPGSVVNLERSLRHGDELGGHFVTGHVDSQATISSIKKSGKNYTLQMTTPEALKPYLAKKGSIAVDGISLTVQSVEEGFFEVGIIPHTLKVTNLGQKKIGSKVNLEADLIARYLDTFQRSIPAKQVEKMNLKQLKKQGF